MPKKYYPIIDDQALAALSEALDGEEKPNFLWYTLCLFEYQHQFDAHGGASSAARLIRERMEKQYNLKKKDNPFCGAEAAKENPLQ